MITDKTLAAYCRTEPGTRLAPVHEERLRMAIIEAERLCLLEPTIRDEHVRVMQTRIVSLTIGDEMLHSLTVIRAPRYSVRERHAPKRPNLFRRLMGMLR